MVECTRHYVEQAQNHVVSCVSSYRFFALLPFVAGIEDEFLFTGRLDNLGMSYCSLAALLDCYPSEGHLADESAVKAIALFDHEEVGSASAQGKAAFAIRAVS